MCLLKMDFNGAIPASVTVQLQSLLLIISESHCFLFVQVIEPFDMLTSRIFNNARTQSQIDAQCQVSSSNKKVTLRLADNLMICCCSATRACNENLTFFESMTLRLGT
jgi:hypothetical protein